jgi:protein required for attachment to host cells
MRDHPIWVLVADARLGRILERPAMGAAWEERTEESSAAGIPASRDIGSDRPGRAFESVGMARHAIQPRQDPHVAAEAAFARQLAEKLEDWARAGRFRQLYLMAPPAFLGQLRPALGDATRKVLRGTLDKDLTKAPLAEVIGHLSEHRPA